MPASPADEDFLPFDHPVRKLPGLLDALDRRAPARARPPEPVRRRPEVPWRLRVRRWSLGWLAATGVLFLALQLSGILPGVFSHHMPILAVAAVLVLGGTAQRVPPGTPQFKNPVNRALLAAIVFYIVGGSAIRLASTAPPTVNGDLYRGVYSAMGVIALLAVVGILVGPRKPGAKRPRHDAGGAEEMPPRAAVLAACREALEKIARNAPRDAPATGWLDLRGPEQRDKLVSHDAKGWRYRDVWWRLRLPWEDGVRLRLAGVEQLRIRPDGRRRESTFLLLVNLAVDPRRWRTEPGPLRAGDAGALVIDGFAVTPSRVSARVVGDGWAFQPADLIGLIKAMETKIHRVSGEAPAGGEA